MKIYLLQASDLIFDVEYNIGIELIQRGIAKESITKYETAVINITEIKCK